MRHLHGGAARRALLPVRPRAHVRRLRGGARHLPDVPLRHPAADPCLPVGGHGGAAKLCRRVGAPPPPHPHPRASLPPRWRRRGWRAPNT
eukprot:7379891-Prymnesium_polylepis.2